MKEKNKKFIQVFAIALIMLLIASASYAYFAAQVSDASSTNIIVNTSTVDNLTFETGDAISISANQSNFTEGSGNQRDDTYASATLVANNDTNDASANYYLYIKIDTNEFEYTTSDKIAELILSITDPDGNEVTSLSGLTYTSVTDGEGNTVSGFDITSKIGLITIAECYLIESAGSNTQEWNIEVTLVNLDSDQSGNADKSFRASIYIQGDIYCNIYKCNTLQAVGSTSYSEKIWAYKGNITKVVFDDTGSSISDYEEVYDISLNEDNSILAYVLDNGDSTYTVYIESDAPITGNEDMSHWFHNFYNLKTIEGLGKLITSNVTNMSWMFYNCFDLISLDLSSFDTSNVTTMYCMFGWCRSLTSLDLSMFDTSKVENMSYMFWSVLNLTELDLSSFDTSNVTTMYCMFAKYTQGNYYSNLETIIFGDGWDTSNVTTMDGMFSGLDSLTSLDLSNFDTSKVTIMAGMFEDCNSLTTLDLSNWDTSKVQSMSYMFWNCASLTSLNLSNASFTAATTYDEMFYNNSSSITVTVKDSSAYDFITARLSEYNGGTVVIA